VADALFDTTFFIDLRRSDPAAEAIWADIRRGDMTGAYSVITVFELWVAQGITRLEELFYEGAFRHLSKVDLTFSVAQAAARLVRGIRSSVPEALWRDALIAASGLERGEPVYTRNVRDMQRFGATVARY
jgi:predicted nucleic acid-binding protein